MDINTDYSNIKWQENGKLKLLIIVGTRPEIIRLAAVISKCRKYFGCILAHTGQNYDYKLNGSFFLISWAFQVLVRIDFFRLFYTNISFSYLFCYIFLFLYYKILPFRISVVIY